MHYPDGRIAVNVVAGDGIPPGLFTTFFKNKGKKDVIGEEQSDNQEEIEEEMATNFHSTTLQAVGTQWAWARVTIKTARRC